MYSVTRLHLRFFHAAGVTGAFFALLRFRFYTLCFLFFPGIGRKRNGGQGGQQGQTKQGFFHGINSFIRFVRPNALRRECTQKPRQSAKTYDPADPAKFLEIAPLRRCDGDPASGFVDLSQIISNEYVISVVGRNCAVAEQYLSIDRSIARFTQPSSN